MRNRGGQSAIGGALIPVSERAAPARHLLPAPNSKASFEEPTEPKELAQEIEEAIEPGTGSK